MDRTQVLHGIWVFLAISAADNGVMKRLMLLLPLLVPVVSGAVRATSELLSSGSLAFEPVQLLLVTDATYLIVSFLAFEYVLDE